MERTLEILDEKDAILKSKKQIQDAFELLDRQEEMLLEEQEYLRAYIHFIHGDNGGTKWLIEHGYGIPPLTRTRTVDKDEVAIWSTPTTI